MIKAIQAIVVTHCRWKYRGSSCVKTLCIASLCEGFENRLDERAA